MFLKILFSHILLVILAVSTVKSSERSAPVIESPVGTFQGKTLTSASGVEYAAYRGIPYALPPTGKRRFARPEAFPKIKGIVDATEFGPICVQAVGRTPRGQEDCLYLNVFTPLEDKSADVLEVKLKKVMVFIHGGGLVAGSSNKYLPGDLVTRADILVVTLNHRLGWLGFFRGNSDSLPGNQAFWDQLLALQWVKDNIRAFGGDPDNVTLAGQSSGSHSSSVLSVSPLAKDLFTKVILMSGISHKMPTPLHSANDMLYTTAPILGCQVNPDNEEFEEVIACLLNLPAEALSTDPKTHPFMPLISSGDNLWPRDIMQLVRERDHLAEVGFFARNYLLTSTKDDGYIRVVSKSNEVDISTRASALLFISKLTRFRDTIADLLLSEYTKLYDDLEKSMIALCTDIVFVMPNLKFVDTYSLNFLLETPTDNRVTLLSFDNTPGFMPNSYMAHGLDIAYVFDVDPKELVKELYSLDAGEFTDEDLRLKHKFIDLLKIFMDTGTLGKSLHMDFGLDFSPSQYASFSQESMVGEDILGERRKIWAELLPQWMYELDEKKRQEMEELEKSEREETGEIKNDKTEEGEESGNERKEEEAEEFEKGIREEKQEL